jgi:hypothetical protein
MGEGEKKSVRNWTVGVKLLEEGSRITRGRELI